MSTASGHAVREDLLRVALSRRRAVKSIVLGFVLVAAPIQPAMAGDPTPAANQGSHAAELSPHATKGMAAFNQHQFDEAIRELEPAVTESPEPHLLAMLAASYSVTGRLDDASAAYAKAIAAAPTDAGLLTEAAMVLVRRGQFPAAVTDLRKAATLHPNDAALAAQLAKILFLSGQRDEARSEFEKILSKAPNNSEAHAGLAACLQVSGDLAGAAREYLAALDMGHDRNSVFSPLLAVLQAYSQTGDASAYAKDALKYFPGDATLSGLAKHGYE